MRALLIAAELLVLSALILATRCSNHDRVFVGQGVYFTDADCYARMSRVRLCHEHPGLIVRHHDFENYPDGTMPHTTAPFDYLTLLVSGAAEPFASNPIDFAGATISPILALVGGLFLWFWSYAVGFRYRWPSLLLYAVSPILVQGTELGRPDHQSLLILLVTVALGSEWMMATKPSRLWAILAGASWSFALWVSFYEPLILFLLVQGLSFYWRGIGHFRNPAPLRKIQWFVSLGTILLALAVERRIPSLSFLEAPFVKGWAGSIGELQHVPFFSAIWFQWGTLLLLAAPVFFLILAKARRLPLAWLVQVKVFLCLLGATFLLTMSQARWGYFFLTIAVVILPGLLEWMNRRPLAWAAVVISFWPVASFWDAQLWPNNDAALEREVAIRENIQLRELAGVMKSPETRPFLAPWWLSPELAYWSGQPGVAGSSHESLPGIVDSARVFSSTNGVEVEGILQRRRVSFVVGYDADRVAQTSGKILGITVNPAALCYLLDRRPSHVPAFLVLAAQNQAGKVYKAVNNR